MATLSYRIPESAMDQLEQLAEQEDVSVSEIARECVMDGVGLRTGTPVMIPDGGATLVQQVKQIRVTQSALLAVLAAMGAFYGYEVLTGTPQLVTYALALIIGVAALMRPQWLP
jgi:hypothetical protein